MIQPEGYFKWEPNPSVAGQDHTRVYNQAEAALLTEQDLMDKPFFDPILEHSSTTAVLLAQAIPARTFATGRNSVGIFGLENENNFDMHSARWKNGWWRDEPEFDMQRWRHGDIKDVAYLYTHKVFDKFVELGELNQ